MHVYIVSAYFVDAVSAAAKKINAASWFCGKIYEKEEQNNRSESASFHLISSLDPDAKKTASFHLISSLDLFPALLSRFCSVGFFRL